MPPLHPYNNDVFRKGGILPPAVRFAVRFATRFATRLLL